MTDLRRTARPGPPLVALLLAVTLATAACGSDPEPAAEASDDIAGTTVTLMTHDSFNVSEEVLEEFEGSTGATVEILRGGDAGTMVNQAILSRDNPQADVLFGIDNTFLSRALDEGLFVPHAPEALEYVDAAFVVDDEHRVTPIDHGDVCLNYDVAYFADNDVPVPTALEDLTDPAYAGDLVVTNPATSSPGLAFMLATIEHFGEDGWLDYWEDLRAADVAVTPGWEDAYYGRFSGASADGERPLVLSYASSPPAEVHYAETELEEAPTGVIEGSCFRQIEFAGALEGAGNEPGARQLIDFMLSERFQEDIPLQMFVFPVNERATLPEVFVEHAVVPDDPIDMDYRRAGEHREEWVEEWTQTVLR